MQKAYRKDVFRSIGKSKKRFLSLVVITALGVTMLTGLYAACKDMYYSADQFYDEQNLFDIRILSTLGLTRADVDALSELEQVASVTGAYNGTAYTDVEGVQKEADIQVLCGAGMNRPYLLEGTLPAGSGEIAVTQDYIDESGKTIGDIVFIEEDTEAENASEEDSDEDFDFEVEEEDSAMFVTVQYQITAIVLDPMDISSSEGATSFRSTAVSDYTFFITEEDVDSDVYTAIYITLEGAREMISFAQEYEELAASVTSYIESYIRKQREEARYAAVIQEAEEKIADADAVMQEKFLEADGEIADARATIAEARAELADGEKTLSQEEEDALQQLSDAREELESARKKLSDAQRQLDNAQAELDSGEAEMKKQERTLADGKAAFEAEKAQALKQLEEGKVQLDSAQTELDSGLQQAQAGADQLKGAFGDMWPEQVWEQLVSAVSGLAAQGAGEAALKQHTVSQQAELQRELQSLAEEIEGEIHAQRAQLEEGISQILQQQEQVRGQKAEYQTRQADLQQQLDEARKGLEEVDPESENYQNQWYLIQELEEGLDQLTLGLQELESVLDQLEEGVSQARAGLELLTQQSGQLDGVPEAAVAAGIGLGQVRGSQTLVNSQIKALEVQRRSALAQLDQAEAELKNGETQLRAARKKMESGKAELKGGKQELTEGWKELYEGEARLEKEEEEALLLLEEGWEELEEGRTELESGEAELNEKEQEYLEKKAEALQKIGDAYGALSDIDMTQWYVQDRTSLDSYSGLKSDLSSIEKIGKAFPVVFLLVAILISLTTMTRMVEEERGLIGTYKALGIFDGAIYGKYLLYAFLACLAGGVLGDFAGFVLLPKFVSVIFEAMYRIPTYYLQFDILYGVGGVLLFMVGIVGATAITCRKELVQVPAALMRPRSPKAGSRVILEYIPALWSRLRFLNKVTMRNLFRYKKRMLMTVGGIAGCTALVLAGFAIRDSVQDLMPKQYQETYRYDLMLVAKDKEYEELQQHMEADTWVQDYMDTRVESVKLMDQDGNSETVQMIVIPGEQNHENFLGIRSTSGRAVIPGSHGVYVTQNAAELLEIDGGSQIFIQDQDLHTYETAVEMVVQNYLGNCVYIAQDLYETLVGEYQPNSMLALVSDECQDQRSYAEDLLLEDYVLSVVSIEAMKDDFSTSFSLINAVLYLIIFMAAGLAFVVLFTLSNTNISERERELATIKVLGFYDGEVHQYVNKETLILTGIGVVAGLPIGRALSGLMTSVLKLPSIYFAVHIEGSSYLLAAVISFSFAIVVDLITNRTLDRINMVEALKSVE